ncbi:hypothetical protein JZ751_017502 [Albula glossodonta]|uniref:EGF-like domain-containing protein n=1 Tax=Albula glossodonta TaxID=121402 RepID=A0A8T2PLG7_9TELE|nr:hypothetical protein JZ751_017502 [Albula glossodonta]
MTLSPAPLFLCVSSLFAWDVRRGLPPHVTMCPENVAVPPGSRAAAVSRVSGCQPGTYGLNCNQVCQCSERNQHCHPVTGLCYCAPGYYGPGCKLECEKGHYGPNCERLCQCMNGGVCQRTTGTCECPPGYIGAHCNISEYTHARLAATERTVPRLHIVPGVRGMILSLGDVCVVLGGEERTVNKAALWAGSDRTVPRVVTAVMVQGVTLSLVFVSVASAGLDLAAKLSAQGEGMEPSASSSVTVRTMPPVIESQGYVAVDLATMGTSANTYAPLVSMAPAASSAVTAGMGCPATPTLAAVSVLQVTKALVCKQGRFGEDCAKRCDCEGKTPCDPLSGRCLCPSGKTGTRMGRSVTHGMAAAPAFRTGLGSPVMKVNDHANSDTGGPCSSLTEAEEKTDGIMKTPYSTTLCWLAIKNSPTCTKAQNAGCNEPESRTTTLRHV